MSVWFAEWYENRKSLIGCGQGFSLLSGLTIDIYAVNRLMIMF